MSSPPSGFVESPAEFEFERTLMVGGFMGCLTYGLHLAVYLMAMRYLFKTIQRDKLRAAVAWAFYMTVLLAMATTYISANMKGLVDAYINHRDFPGGPLAYAAHSLGSPLIVAGTNVAPTVAILVADGLLVWRLYIIWGTIWITLIPGLMWLGSTIMGILLIVADVETIKPGSVFNSENSVRFGTAYFALSLSLTLLVTCLIVGRITYFRRKVSRIVTGLDPYVSASAILIESSALYSVFALIVLILYNTKSPVLNIFQQVIVQILGISSDAIILRVAIGRAWTAASGEKVSTLVFSSSSRVFPQESATKVGDIESIGRKEAKSDGSAHFNVH